MQVAVEHPVEKSSFEKRDHLRPQHGGRVDPDRPHPLHVVPGEAVETFHNQHAASYEARMWARDDDRALVRFCQNVADVEHVGRLEPEVELLDDRLREELDQRRRVGKRGNRDPADEEGREEAHGRQVTPHEFRDVGPLHLDDDTLASSERRAVHLGDRRRRDGGTVEFGEGAVQGTRELCLDDPAHGVEGLWRHPVAEQAELRDDLLREDAFTGGEDLPELDVRRTERPEGDAKPARQSQAGPRPAPTTIEQVPGSDRLREREADLDDAVRRGQAPAPDEARDLGPSPGADDLDTLEPLELVRIDQPGRIVAEAAEFAVRWP